MSTKMAPIKRRQIANKYSKIPKRINDKMITPGKNNTTGQAPVTSTIAEIRKEVVDKNAMKGNSSFKKTSVQTISHKNTK